MSILVVLCLLLWVGPGVALGQTPGSITMQWEQATLEQALSALQQMASFEVDIPDDLRSYPLGVVFLRAGSIEEAVTELLSGTRINYAAQYSQGRLQRLVVLGLAAPATAATREGKKQDHEEVAEERTVAPSPPVVAADRRYEKKESESDEQSSEQSPVGFVGSGHEGAASGGGAMAKPEGATAAGTASSSDTAGHIREMERNLTRGGQSPPATADAIRRVEEWRRMWLGQTSNPR